VKAGIGIGYKCNAREIPCPAGENAGLRDDFLLGGEVMFRKTVPLPANQVPARHDYLL